MNVILTALSLLAASPSNAEPTLDERCRNMTLAFAAEIIDGINVARTNVPRAILSADRIVKTMVKYNLALNLVDTSERLELEQCVDQGVASHVAMAVASIPKDERPAIRPYFDELARQASFEPGTRAALAGERVRMLGHGYSALSKIVIAAVGAAMIAPVVFGIPDVRPIEAYELTMMFPLGFAVLVDRVVSRLGYLHVDGAGSPVRACAGALEAKTFKRVKI